MTRLLHLLPIILIIASVTATLRAREKRTFWHEFSKASLSLAAGFAGLAVVVFLMSLFL